MACEHESDVIGKRKILGYRVTVEAIVDRPSGEYGETMTEVYRHVVKNVDVQKLVTFVNGGK